MFLTSPPHPLLPTFSLGRIERALSSVPLPVIVVEVALHVLSCWRWFVDVFFFFTLASTIYSATLKVCAKNELRHYWAMRSGPTRWLRLCRANRTRFKLFSEHGTDSVVFLRVRLDSKAMRNGWDSGFFRVRTLS